MNRNALVLIAAAFGFVFIASASGQIEPTHPDLPYASTHELQKLDLYLPPGPGAPHPLIIWIHGGGWQGGDKSSAARRAGPLVDLGFAVAGINYRLSQHGTFPAQIHDCKGAVRWLRAHAEQYGLDPSRFGVWGSSAGGHLSALVGTSGGVVGLEGNVGGNLGYSSRVQAAADYFGPTDFFEMGGWHNNCTSPESRMLGVCLGQVVANRYNPGWAAQVALVESAGSVYSVTPEDPPFHIAHGTEDKTVPPGQSQLLYDALVAAGVPARLRMVPGAGHGLPPGEDQFVRDFFVAQLSDPPRPGDLNCDGQVTFADIDPFVLALTGETAYLNKFRACNWYNADVNRDGKVDFDDIDPFVSLLGS